VKLILNVIAPDNFVRKFAELRKILFEDMKSKKECDEEGIEFDAAVH